MIGFPRSTAQQLLKRISAAGLAPPRELTVSVTSKCNLRCEHCWVECSPDRGAVQQVDAAALQSAIREFVALGGEEVCITGGEPLVHPNWPELLAVCCSQPGLRRVVLQTNATLIDGDTLTVFCEVGADKLFFQVSLDGCTEATHDLIRGPGSLRRALHGLRCLVEAGYGPRTTIAFTEMQHNFEEIPQLLELADNLGLDSVVGLPLIKSGNAKQSPLALMPTQEQYIDLLERYERHEVIHERYQKRGCFSAVEWMKGVPSSVHTGCCFLEKPYVTAAGMLFPCAMLQVNGYAGRGVFAQSLSDVIGEALPLWSDLMWVSKARLSQLSCIESCEGGAHCGGGCLARAYIPTGDLAAREDRCELRQAVYSWCARRKRSGEC